MGFVGTQMARLGEYITEYSQKNTNNEYRPVAVGKYGIRSRESIYKKELAADYSKNKVIFKDTLTVGMGSKQIDIGILSEDECYSVSPAYRTYKISGIDSKYLGLCLQAKNKEMFESYVKQSARQGKTIDFKRWLDFEIPVPKEQVQTKIVDDLEMLNELITYQEEKVALLDELVKARFVELFGDPINNNKQWPISTVGAIATDVKYGTSRPATKGGKFPYLRMNNLTYDGYLDLTDLKYIDIPDNEYEKCVVRRGDILFNRTNSVDLIGKTVAYDRPDEMIIAGYIIRVRLNDKLLPEVFSQYMNLEVMKKTLSSMAKGAVHQANINAQELKSIEVYLPEIGLQKEFVAFKQHIDKSKFIETLRLAKRKQRHYN